MIHDIKKDIEERVEWIKSILKQSGTKGIVFGASGGKDSVLAGILCRMASENVIGIIMPCESKRNYTSDKEDALLVNKQFDIKSLEVDLTKIKKEFTNVLETLVLEQEPMAYANINPRLRMITLYNIAQRKGYLVSGTSNRSEITMGYFTKWGDAGCDFNPIADLTVREVYAMLNYFEVFEEIIKKAPSAGLYEGQTDELEMGVTYDEIDDYLLKGKTTSRATEIIEKAFNRTSHKRENVKMFSRK